MADFERKSAILRQFAHYPVSNLNGLGVAPGPGPHLVCSLPDVFPLPPHTHLLTLLEGRTDADFLSGECVAPHATTNALKSASVAVPYMDSRECYT